MSRIGKLPVAIPQGVEVNINGSNITVKGKKGELSFDFEKHANVEVKDNEVIITRFSDEKKDRALHGLTRSLIQNMVTGVSDGFR
jgi:large subunit ribosomal protein L6